MTHAPDFDEAALRLDLAVAFRLAHSMGWSESVANHFSAALTPDGRRFLLNPKWQHFASIKASDLIVVDLDDGTRARDSGAVDVSAFTIHGTLHAAIPGAKILLHCHPDYATALSTLKDPSFKPIDQNTCRFYNRIAIDRDFGGMADEAAEGERLAKAMGNHSAMMMGNHGVTVSGSTVADAFEDLYYLEKAAKTMMLAYASGQKLNVLSPEIAEKTARSWDDFKGTGEKHFNYLKSELMASEPDVMN